VRVIDPDVVELENLHRQLLYTEADAHAAVPKAEAAFRRLRSLNSAIRIKAFSERLGRDNIFKLLGGVKVVVDASDNMETRFLLNDYAVRTGTPWIYCGAVASTGMTMTIIPGETACFRCFIRNLPPPGTLPTAATAGVLNTVTSAISAFACAEAIKLLSGKGRPARGMAYLDVWEGSFHRFEVPRQKDCPCCVHGLFEFLMFGKEATGR
jgi:adenylyltransferase/sulfurtransferase